MSKLYWTKGGVEGKKAPRPNNLMIKQTLSTRATHLFNVNQDQHGFHYEWTCRSLNRIGQLMRNQAQVLEQACSWSGERSTVIMSICFCFFFHLTGHVTRDKFMALQEWEDNLFVWDY